MASFNKFQSFVELMAEKAHNLGSDVLKVMLTNSAPVATNTVKANLTEISGGNGYTAGGETPSITSSAQTSGTYKLVLGDVTWTAAGGTIGPFRYWVLYNDTAANDELIGWWDYASSITLNAGDTFTVDFDASTGVLTIA
jgi:flagellar capping protein FliD